MRRVWRTLGKARAQLLVVFAAATLLPLIITLVQIHDERGRAERRASDEAQQTARLAAGELQDLLDSAQAIAQVVESSPRFWTTDDEGHDAMLAELALTHKLPAVTLFTDFAREGGLMAYGPNLLGTVRLTGMVLAKVLQGARPADVPVERPTKFEMVINLVTAKALGLSLPPSLLMRADEVIE